MARKIVVTSDRRAYFTMTLVSDNYTEDKAKQAEMWMLYGDWSMKGNDPTMTLDDLYPSAQQYESAVAKYNGNIVRKSNLYVPEEKETATPEQAQEALRILHQKTGGI